MDAEQPAGNDVAQSGTLLRRRRDAGAQAEQGRDRHCDGCRRCCDSHRHAGTRRRQRRRTACRIAQRQPHRFAEFGRGRCGGRRQACRAAAPLDFTLKDMNGVDVKLAAFKGKPIVLNFWATWCGPCRAEIPSLVELQS